MVTRRMFGACALCSAVGLVATAVEAGQPPPFTRTIIKKSEFPGDRYATVLVEVAIAPNALVPWHIHPGIESAIITDGEGTLMVKGEADRVVKPGDGFQIPPFTPHSVQNGGKVTKVAITYVVEKDKPIASPVPPPA